MGYHKCYDNLKYTDLIIDNIYGDSRQGNAADDPLPKLLGVDSGAGFRHLGKRPRLDTLKMIMLKSNFNNTAWPDYLDPETGLLIYYGDNQKPGKELHDTPRMGNLILRNLFVYRQDTTLTEHFPPIFVFGSTGVYRDVRFLGLAVPGSETLGSDEDLVAVWKSYDKQRFQNYKAIFTILDVPLISRKWITDIIAGNAGNSQYAPENWSIWIQKRIYKPLLSQKSIEIRNKVQQLPEKPEEIAILKKIYSRYKDDPFSFENCAVKIARLMIPDIHTCELTRPWRDGGRDAIGVLKIGKWDSSIVVTFALEAKCYSPNTSVGVKELSRLLSRLKYRQFGILVTTSYLGKQAYEELKSDDHPVVIISGGDIAQLLYEKFGDMKQIDIWLDAINKKNT